MSFQDLTGILISITKILKASWYILPKSYWDPEKLQLYLDYTNHLLLNENKKQIMNVKLL